MSVQNQERSGLTQKVADYIRGCVDPKNARLYGTFQERAALNITQFPKVQTSLLTRMGVIYPALSSVVESMGIPHDSVVAAAGVSLNMHSYVTGYLAYAVEIASGVSKYAIEGIERLASTAVHVARGETVPAVEQKPRKSLSECLHDAVDPEKARLYGTLPERLALLTTQFFKIHGSMIIRQGIVYPLVSKYLADAGLSVDSHTTVLGATINFHSWAAGYFSYLIENQTGLSKYPIEAIGRALKPTEDNSIDTIVGAIKSAKARLYD